MPNIIEIVNDYKNTELLVWDNASLDKTREVLGNLGGRYKPDVLHLHHENVGKLAMQQLILWARGRFILELDADMECPKGFVRAMVRTMLQFPRIGLLSLNMEWMRVGGFLAQYPELRDYQLKDRFGSDTGVFIADHTVKTQKEFLANGSCRMSRRCMYGPKIKLKHKVPYITSLGHHKATRTDRDITRQVLQAGWLVAFLEHVNNQKAYHHGNSYREYGKTCKPLKNIREDEFSLLSELDFS